MGEKEQGGAGQIPGKPTKEQRIAAGDDAPPAGIAVSDPGVPNRTALPGSEGGASPGGEPSDADTAIVKSKSNITNN